MDVFKTLILDTPTVEGANGTVTSVDLTAGTGISVSGGPITSSGSITVTNTSPDQTVALTGGTGISTSGTYPNFTITNDAPDQTVALTGGTGISTSGAYPNFTITNDAPDQTVSIAAGTGISTSGTYPSFTVTNSAPDQTVSIASGTGISVTGSYPSFTVTNSSPSLGGDVVGPASSTDNGIVRFDGTTGKLVQDSSSVVIDDSGNVGIGTASPGTTLVINKNASVAPTPLTGSLLQVLNADSTSSGMEVVAIGSGIQPIFNFRRSFGTGASLSAVISGGNLGLIQGSGYDGTSWSNPQVSLSMNAAETWTSTAHGTIATISTTPIGSTTISERLRIDSTGNVGIGTASPASKLDVNGNVAVTGVVTAKSPSTATDVIYAIQSSSSNKLFNISEGGSGAGNAYVYDSSGAVSIALYGGTGQITATGNITAYYSDDRLKTKLGNIENALDKVSKLNGFYYEANETAQALGYKPVREVGLSAQQVEAVLPEVVAPAPIDNEYKTLHYERVIPLLVEAIKELKAEIELLKK